MMKIIKIQIASGIFILIAFILGVSFWVIGRQVGLPPDFVKIGKKSEKMVCTEEVRTCSNGSFVGRIGPRCEFAKCAGE